ncbi:MAG: ABC transporter permease subunit, partial [Hydrogenoanaerobacterium sp.]
PQAFKAVLPTYTNEFVVLIKETSIAGYVTIRDLTKVSDMIRNTTYNAWVPLFAAAIIYLALTLGLSQLFAVLERKMARSDRG